jgi:hypothetical protein
VQCIDLPPNDCGGCLPSTLEEGDDCSVCGNDGEIVCVADPFVSGDEVPLCDADASDVNQCGGCTPLSGNVAQECGVCGILVCGRDAESLNCFDPCD